MIITNDVISETFKNIKKVIKTNKIKEVIKINKIKEVIKILINFIYPLIDFIYPRNISCIICDKPIGLKNTYSLCKDCFKEMNFLKDACLKCGRPIINHSLEMEHSNCCSECYDKTYYFDRAISCIEYNQISKRIVLDFKYKSKTYLCKYIAQIISEKLYLEDINADYILFVPIHKKRLKKRGFNQSEKIAKDLSKILKIPVKDSIFRIKNTKKLHKLNRREREEEVKNSFLIKDDNNELKNKNIILIDDIFTTGSTVNEISKELRLCSVGKIIVVTLLSRSSDRYIGEKYY